MPPQDLCKFPESAPLSMRTFSSATCLRHSSRRRACYVSSLVFDVRDSFMSDDMLRQLAHEAMSLAPSPWLRYHKGRHVIEDGIALHLQEPFGPSFNYAASL